MLHAPCEVAWGMERIENDNMRARLYFDILIGLKWGR